MTVIIANAASEVQIIAIGWCYIICVRTYPVVCSMTYVSASVTILIGVWTVWLVRFVYLLFWLVARSPLLILKCSRTCGTFLSWSCLPSDNFLPPRTTINTAKLPTLISISSRFSPKMWAFVVLRMKGYVGPGP